MWFQRLWTLRQTFSCVCIGCPPTPAPVRPQCDIGPGCWPFTVTVGLRPESYRGAGFAWPLEGLHKTPSSWSASEGPTVGPTEEEEPGGWVKALVWGAWGHTVPVDPGRPHGPSQRQPRTQDSSGVCSCARRRARLVLSVISVIAVLSRQMSTNSFSLSSPPSLPSPVPFQFLFLFLFFSLAFILWS